MQEPSPGMRLTMRYGNPLLKQVLSSVGILIQGPYGQEILTRTSDTVRKKIKATISIEGGEPVEYVIDTQEDVEMSYDTYDGLLATATFRYPNPNDDLTQRNRWA